MKQLLTALALASLAVACGDDSDNTPIHTDSGVDAGPRPDAAVGDGGMDGGTGTAKVANAGAACTTGTVATDCGGSAPVCAPATWSGIAYPGNHCQATCTANSDCGGNGACPIGAAIASPIYGSQVAAALMTNTGVCYQKCTVGSSTCRTGYICKTTADALGGGAASMVPEFSAAICIPAAGLIPAQDAGVSHDAGTVSGVDGGLDAGH